ncbi:MAG: hypothetical protein R3297_03835 [Desulfobulbales bacterium]|nr:hypothetical protein [Desulfobulbales bacterium]
MILRAIFLILFWHSLSWAATPMFFNYQGMLNDSAGPVNYDVPMSFRIYDSESAADPVWGESHTSINVSSGIYNVLIGSGTPLSGFSQLSSEVFTDHGNDIWLEVEVAGELLTPRQRIVSVPYAIHANSSDSAVSAENAAAANYATTSGQVAGLCSAGDSVTCFEDDIAKIGVGECKTGKRYCNPEETGFGPCQDQVVSTGEICDDNRDNDCDGEVDEFCDGVPCDDGDPCTYSDVYTGGVCGGTTINCNDNLPCTTDTCNGDGTCTNQVQPGFCAVGGVCFANGTVHPDDECKQCVSGQSQTAWSSVADGTPCEDDGLSCTIDLCSAGSCSHVASPETGQCFIEGECYEHLSTNPVRECQYCNASNNTTWSNKPLDEACFDDGNPCTSHLCDGGGNCVITAISDWTACDDGNSATHGDWCYNQVCSGFSKRLLNGGTNDEYVDASSRGSTGWWHSEGGNLDADIFSGSINIFRLNPVGLLFDDRYFDTTNLDAVGALNSTAEYDGLFKSWSLNSPGSGWDLLPAANFSAVSLYISGSNDWIFGGTQKYVAAGWDTATNSMIVRFCPLNTGDDCRDLPVFGSYYVDCGGSEAIYDNDYTLVCNKYANPGDTWPSHISILTWDATDDRFESIADYTVFGANKKSTTTSSVNFYLVIGGTGGLLRVAKVIGGAVIEASDITLLTSDQDKIDFHDSALWENRIWVVGKRTVSTGTTIISTTITHIVAHADVSSNLSLSTSWRVHEVDSDTFSNFGTPPFPSPEDYSLKGVAGLNNITFSQLYLFGGWWTGNEPDSRDRAVWMWEKP